MGDLISINYKKPKMFGKNEDGLYEGKIEEIGTSKTEDYLYISNRESYAWIFSIFTGYVQLGAFKVKKPHSFEEGDLVIVGIQDDKIITVRKVTK